MKQRFLNRILGLMLILPATIYAQDESSSRFFKVYMNGLVETQTRNLNDFPSDSTIYSLEFHDTDIGYFSPAIGFISEDGDIHEIEISRISIGTARVDSLVVIEDPAFRSFTIEGDQTFTFHMAFRYEYLVNLRKSKPEAALKPYIGFSAQPYFRYFSHRSTITTEFPYSFLDVGAVVSVIPRVTYDLNERWFLDLNIPIAAYRMQWTRDEFTDPTIPVGERITNELSTESFPSIFQVRFGAGMRF